MAEEEFRLDTALYIGIGIDVVLAVIAGVLIYKWRKRVSERKERSRRVDGIYGVSQRTEMETIPMGSTIGADSEMARSTKNPYDVPTPRSGSQTSGGTRQGYTSIVAPVGSRPDAKRVPDNINNEVNTNDERGSRVNYSDIAMDDEPQDTHYPTSSDDRIVRNPLAATDATMATTTSPESAQGENIVSTYYTYKPPKNQLDGESSEIISDGELSPTSSIPPIHSPPPPLPLNQEGDDSEAPPSPPPPPPLPNSGHEYSTIDCVVLEDKKEEDRDTGADGRHSERSWSTANFGEEEVSKLYNIEMEESTQIL